MPGRIRSVFSVEWTKVWAQRKTITLVAACAVGPFVFAVSMQVQSTVPSDTLFGRNVHESGFAIPLVVLGFASLWILPALASSVGGDVFSAEDRYRTWTPLLTRSRTRAEIFVGKVMVASAFSALVVIVLAASSVIAGALIVGTQPLIDLSGVPLQPPAALTRIGFAWASVVMPSLAFTSIAMLLSVATRSSVAGVGLPVVIGLAMQLCSFLDGPERARRLLLTSAFSAWHGLLAQPHFYRPLIDGTLISTAYAAIAIAAAYSILRQRDFAG
jgi:ABC-2 type transport system permease protein